MKTKLLVILLLFLFFSCNKESSQYYLEGKRLYDGENFQKAIESFSKEITLNGGSSMAYLYRGNASQKTGHFQKSIEDFNKAIKIDNELASAYINKSISQTRLKNYDAAINSLSNMINHFKISENDITNRNIAIAYNNRGLVKHLNLEDKQSALEDFNKSISIGIKTEIHLPLMNRGRIYLINQEYKKALKDLDSSIILNKNNALAYYLRSKVHFKMNNFESALSDLSIDSLTNTKEWYYYNQRGLTLIKLERYLESISDFDKAIEMSEEALPYNNRGFSKFKLGKLKEALRDCEKSLELHSENSWAYYNLGLIKYQMKLKEAACADFAMALDLGKIEAQIELDSKCNTKR